MNKHQFNEQKQQFIKVFRQVITTQNNPQLTEAAFNAYSDPNPLIRFLFWRRLWVTMRFLQHRSPFETILDFGCGSGVALPLLAELANRVIGLDVNLDPYRTICDNISFPDSTEIYETTQRSILDFSDNTFDAIISLDVLEHVDNLNETMQQLCRVSKPGGIIIVSGPTETIFYQIGRKIAGAVYTGDYHHRNIYDIRKVMDSIMEVETLATLYYPFPLFKVFIGHVPEKKQ